MLINKENVILINSWTLNNLFNPKFWGQLLEVAGERNYTDLPMFDFPQQSDDVKTNPIIEERFRKDHMIGFLWNLIPQEHKISFFDDEYTVYYIWASEISTVNLIKLHDFLIKRDVGKIPSFISGISVYKKMVESKNNAYSDMINPAEAKEIVLMKFYDKLAEEGVITLNTPEYVMVSGIDTDKVDALRDQLLKEKGYSLSHVIDYTGADLVPIYVLFPKK